MLDAADEARQAGVIGTTNDPDTLWAITWPTRSAAWMPTHRGTLESALHRPAGTATLSEWWPREDAGAYGDPGTGS